MRMTCKQRKERRVLIIGALIGTPLIFVLFSLAAIAGHHLANS